MKRIIGVVVFLVLFAMPALANQARLQELNTQNQRLRGIRAFSEAEINRLELLEAENRGRIEERKLVEQERLREEKRQQQIEAELKAKELEAKEKAEEEDDLPKNADISAEENMSEVLE